jgi:hypothetical protein
LADSDFDFLVFGFDEAAIVAVFLASYILEGMDGFFFAAFGE